MIKLRVLRWEDSLSDLGWPNIITSILIRGRQKHQSERRAYDDRNRVQSDARDAGGLRTEKARKQLYLPWSLQKEDSPAVPF